VRATYEGEAVVEYGGGINNGPAGQVGGGGNVVSGGGSPAANQPDVFASITNTFSDIVDQVAALPTEMLVVGIVAFFLGLIVLKRAF
jgi:hypothetical protein